MAAPARPGTPITTALPSRTDSAWISISVLIGGESRAAGDGASKLTSVLLEGDVHGGARGCRLPVNRDLACNTVTPCAKAIELSKPRASIAEVSTAMTLKGRCMHVLQERGVRRARPAGQARRLTQRQGERAGPSKGRPPLVLDTHEIAVTQDDVVHQLHIQHRARLAQLPRQVHVLPARRRVA